MDLSHKIPTNIMQSKEMQNKEMLSNKELIEKLNENHHLDAAEWEQLFATFTEDDRAFAAEMARTIAVKNFGKRIFFRGIVEFSNICKNDCLYCGIRKSNCNVERYRLNAEQIMACCQAGYDNGFRTFVLQGGEDGWFNDERMCEIVSQIRKAYPDCAITLSLGERSRESYEKLFAAGADRYLLRHETADVEHYGKLHPSDMDWENRIRCLRDLKEIGYQTGCGIMVGSPGQTPKTLAKDMLFMESFQPHMIGVGPFLPHKDTPLREEAKGSVELTLFILALCRIMLPHVLLPSTTALGSVKQDGRKQGVLHGCNVIMPNLSPEDVRKNYMLYDNKAGTNLTASEGIRIVRQEMEEIGYEMVIGRGDFGKERL